MEWVFEEEELTQAHSIMLLVRVAVGKITDLERLKTAVRSVPIVQNDASWNCAVWVQNALAAIEKDGKAVGTSRLEWNTVRDAAKSYVQRKKDENRFNGKAPDGQYDMTRPATYDLLAGREIIP